jgi:hypothetical protein
MRKLNEILWAYTVSGDRCYASSPHRCLATAPELLPSTLSQMPVEGITSFHARLTAIRRAAKTRAQELPMA